MTRNNLLLLIAGAVLGFGTATWVADRDAAPRVYPEIPAARTDAAPARAMHAANLPEEAAPAQTAPTDPATLLLSGSIADIAERVTPSVVTVLAEQKGRSGVPEMLSPYFGPRSGMGSGVIVRADGVILTNNHVIDGAREVRVRLSNGRELDAEVIGADDKSDVAVLRVDATGLPAVVVGNPERLRVGELVLAVGNPFGVGQTVTMGIVSAKGRADLGLTDYENFIQTDAAINPGNSGGALVNSRGELVGINTAIVSRSGGYQGIGFAIPIDMAMSISGQLLADGVVRRGKLGVNIQNLDQEMAETLGLPDDIRGVVISRVEPGSAADLAGVKRRDVVLSVDGRTTTNVHQLRNEIAGRRPNEQVELKLLRDGEMQILGVVLGSLDDAQASAEHSSADPAAPVGAPLSGLTVKELTGGVRKANDLDSRDTGVVVTSVERGSPAWRAGIREGTVLLEVNRTSIRGVEHFAELASEITERVTVLTVDGGRSLYVLIDAE